MKVVEIYLNLGKEVFEKTKNEAIKEADATFGEEEKGKELLYPYIKLLPDKSEGLYFDEDENVIHLAGDFFLSDEADNTKDKLGYLSLSIPLDFELVIDIIEEYRKKLAKVKTILEAAK